jgi:WD40 repeat protein
MTGELLNTLEGHSDYVYSVGWNHDSSRVASGSEDGTIKIWDGVTCELLMTLRDDESITAVTSVSWSHEGDKIASISMGGIVRIWELATGEVLHKLFTDNNAEEADELLPVSWNHDDSKFFSGANGNVLEIWDSFTGKLLKSLEGHSDPIISAAWNRDSSRIVTGSDDTIKIWDAVTGELWNTLEGDFAGVVYVIWNDAGDKIIFVSWGAINIWNVLTGERESTPVEIRAWSMVWNHDGSRIVSASYDDVIRVWKGLEKPARKVFRMSCLSEWNPVDCARIVSGSDDGMIQILDGKTGELLKRWEGHSDEVTSIAWNHDGTRIASSSRDKTIKIWDGVSYELHMTLKGHSDWVYSVSWNHDSSRILSGSKSMLLLYDVITGEKLKTVETCRNSVGRDLTFSWNCDSTKILVEGLIEGVTAIWNAETMVEERQLCNDNSMCSFSWNRDGSKIISGSNDTTIQIWDAESGSLLNTLEGHESSVTLTFWNHDDSKIFSGSRDGTIRIWDGATGQLLKTETVETTGRRIVSMSLTREGDRLVFHYYEDRFAHCLFVQ